jgi:hypothetical protein
MKVRGSIRYSRPRLSKPPFRSHTRNTSWFHSRSRPSLLRQQPERWDPMREIPFQASNRQVLPLGPQTRRVLLRPLRRQSQGANQRRIQRMMPAEYRCRLLLSKHTPSYWRLYSQVRSMLYSPHHSWGQPCRRPKRLRPRSRRSARPQYPTPLPRPIQNSKMMMSGVRRDRRCLR